MFKYLFVLGLVFISLTVSGLNSKDSTCVNLEERLYIEYYTGNFNDKTPKKVLKQCNLVDEEVSFKEAKFKYNTGKFSEAKILFAKITKNTKGKEQANAYYYLGLISFYQDSFNEALDYYQLAEKHKSYKGKLTFEIARCFYGLGLYNESINKYKEILKTEPNNAAVWNNIGANAESLKNYKASLACYVLADSLMKGNRALYKSNIIVALRKLNRDEEAYEIGKEAYEQFPNSFRIVDNLGRVMGNLKKNEESINLCKNFIQDNGPDKDIYYRMAYTYDINGSVDSALFYYYKSLAIDPEQPGATHNISLIYRIIGDFDMALKYLDKTFAIDPNYKNAMHGRINTYLWMHEYEKSYEATLEFQKKYPNDEDLIGSIGYVTMLTGRYDEAIKYLKIDLNFDSLDSKPWNNLGRCYAKKQDYKLANYYFNRALLIDSTNSYVYHNRASMKYDMGDFDSACEDLRRAIAEEYNWAIDSTLYILVENNCANLNLNRRINLHGYKGNITDMKDYNFIELIKSTEKDYEAALLKDSLKFSSFEKIFAKNSNSDNARYSIYPNPTLGYLKIDLKKLEVSTIKIFDYKGVQQMNINVEGKSRVDVDLANYANGSYLIIASTKSEVVFTEQIVKK